MRYSPKPIAAYGRKIDGVWYGPSNLLLLKEDNEAWNLAYLSYDYDKRPVHPDPQFGNAVRSSLQVRLDTRLIDITAGPLETVRCLLRIPAPQFVQRIQVNGLHKFLPLYQAYGAAWLQTIEERSFLCTNIDGDPDNVVDVGTAARYIEALAKKT